MEHTDQTPQTEDSVSEPVAAVETPDPDAGLNRQQRRHRDRALRKTITRGRVFRQFDELHKLYSAQLSGLGVYGRAFSDRGLTAHLTEGESTEALELMTSLTRDAADIKSRLEEVGPRHLGVKIKATTDEQTLNLAATLTDLASVYSEIHGDIEGSIRPTTSALASLMVTADARREVARSEPVKAES